MQFLPPASERFLLYIYTLHLICFFVPHLLCCVCLFFFLVLVWYDYYMCNTFFFIRAWWKNKTTQQCWYRKKNTEEKRKIAKNLFHFQGKPIYKLMIQWTFFALKLGINKKSIIRINRLYAVIQMNLYGVCCVLFF